MKCLRITLAAMAVLGLWAGASSGAGEKKDLADFVEKPGPEHKILAGLEGEFVADVKMYFDPGKEPQVSKGVMKRKMIYDGRFLTESFSGEFSGMKFMGQATVGYDQNKKKYVTTWIDNMSTSIMILHGSYDVEKKTFTNVGDMMEGGKKMENKDVLRIVSATEQTFEMFRRPEGAKEYFKAMEITYTRKKE